MVTMTTRKKTNEQDKHALFNLSTYLRCQSTYCWMPHFAKTVDMPESKSEILNKMESFWEGPLKEIYEEAQKEESRYHVELSPEECLHPDTRKLKVPTS